MDNIYTPPEIITRDSGFMIDSDPTDNTRFIVSTYLNFGARGIHPAITVVSDNTTTLLVKYNFYIKPQQTTGAVLTYKPGVSNMAFPTTGAGFFFGVAHYLDSVTNAKTLMFARINQVTGAVVWASLIPGTAGLLIESMT